jgi:hypothetical protein
MAKQAIEQTGIIPRSIIRTFDRFRKQLSSGSEKLVIQEFRISRFQVLVSIKCLLSLTIIPLVINYFLKNFLLIPVTETFWNRQQNDIFLNSYQQNRAFEEIKKFEEKLYFEFLTNDIDINFAVIPANSQKNNKSVVSIKNIPLQHSRELDSVDHKILLIKTFNFDSNLLPLHQDIKLPNYSVGMTVNDNQKDSNSIIIGNRRTELSTNLNLDNLYNDPVSNKHFLGTNFTGSGPISLLKEQNIEDYHSTNNTLNITKEQLLQSKELLQQEIQEKTIELAIHYNQQSIVALTNLFGDFITFGVISFLIIWMKPQIIILKSFLTESIYSLSDTTKSFLLILGTDLLVGFHSPRGWEIGLELILRHFGFPENQDFIYLFVATFPVLLNTVFKYWIFRYLNQISPSTVATYHSMIE